MRAFASATYLMLYPLNKDRRCKDKLLYFSTRVEISQAKSTGFFAWEMSAAAGELIQDVSTSNITKNLTAR